MSFQVDFKHSFSKDMIWWTDPQVNEIRTVKCRKLAIFEECQVGYVHFQGFLVRSRKQTRYKLRQQTIVCLLPVQMPYVLSYRHEFLSLTDGTMTICITAGSLPKLNKFLKLLQTSDNLSVWQSTVVRHFWNIALFYLLSPIFHYFIRKAPLWTIEFICMESGFEDKAAPNAVVQQVHKGSRLDRDIISITLADDALPGGAIPLVQRLLDELGSELR